MATKDAAHGLRIGPLQIADVQAQISQLETEAEMAGEDLNGARVRLQQIHDQQDATKAKADRARKELGAQAAALGQMASLAYQSGGLDSSVQLLLAETPADFLQLVVAERGGRAIRLAELALDAGLPAGALSVVTGDAEVGDPGGHQVSTILCLSAAERRAKKSAVTSPRATSNTSSRLKLRTKMPM